MNNQTLVIHESKILFEILIEIKDYLNFNLININKITDFNLNKNDDYLIVSKKKIKNFESMIILNNQPIDLIKFIESINIKFLKKI